MFHGVLIQDLRLSSWSAPIIHPTAAVLGFPNFDLHLWGSYIRMPFANLRRRDATRPLQLATRFASWSDLRSALFRRWPYHIVVWYALLGAGIVLVLRAKPSPAAARMAWIAAGLSLAAVGEHAVASLADSCETGRHLFLFAAALSGTLQASLRRRLPPINPSVPFVICSGELR